MSEKLVSEARVREIAEMALDTADGTASMESVVDKMRLAIREAGEAAANVCEDAPTYDEDDPGSSYAAAIRKRLP